MNYTHLEKNIGYQFRDIALLDLAMTHPAYALTHKCPDNQRLEFLGDAVLQIAVSRVVYDRFPALKEGQLTKKRSCLVCEANLAKAAIRLGIGSFLKLDHGEESIRGRENPSILADAMESVIAAVYLDGGMDAAKKLIDLAMDGYETNTVPETDAKSMLQIVLQKDGQPAPTYELLGEEGPDHAKIFFVRVLCSDGTELGRGSGNRKQRAEETAANQALRKLGIKQ